MSNAYYMYAPKRAVHRLNYNCLRAEQLVEDASIVKRRAREAKHERAAELAFEAAVSANLAADYYVEVHGRVAGRPAQRRGYARLMARQACEAMGRAKATLARAVEALDKIEEGR